MRLNIENMSFSYAETKAADEVCFDVKKGEFVGLIGPNGSGKSTVLKTLYKALKPDSGIITLDGENLLEMSHKKSALKLGAVGQENDVPFDFSAEEIVAMGRSPHKKLFDADTAHDKNIINNALNRLGIGKMAKRSYLHMSGGEKQRVIIARVIAQETDFLLLDEPANHLDIHYQLQIFDFIKQLKVTVLSAMHDLNMAALYCDRIYALKDGRVVLHGTPEEIFTPGNIYDVYNVRCDIMKHPLTGKISIIFLPAGSGG
ncbi:MAG: ABC transporter ATP-binding protein [Oscillospiraceae bacterium]|nr:ABC transporter ATP-binding protein [Oscillospiraceae bacterium]